MKNYTFLFFLVLLTSCSTPLPKRQLNKEAVDELVQTGRLKPIVDELAKPLIDNKIVIGAAVGVIAPGFGEHIYTYGRKSVNAPAPVDADTLFQIGSMTKVFTTAILAKWAVEKRIKLTDEVRQHYNYHIPLQKPKSTGCITFLQLASHSSGLPREFYNKEGLMGMVNFFSNGDSPWSDFNVPFGMIYFNQLDIEPGKHAYSYSNFGIAILGILLGQMDGSGYENVLQKQMLGPLGLSDTFLYPNEEQKKRIADGHTGDLPPFHNRNIVMPHWKFHTNANASGGLYSSPKDLMKFLKMNMGITKTNYLEAFKIAHQKRLSAKKGFVGMSWFTKKLKNSQKEIVYTDGMFGGFTSFLGFSLEHQVGVTVVINNINYDDHIGLALMDRIISALEREKTLTKISITLLSTPD